MIYFIKGNSVIADLTGGPVKSGVHESEMCALTNVVEASNRQLMGFRRYKTTAGRKNHKINHISPTIMFFFQLLKMEAKNGLCGAHLAKNGYHRG